ncbi:MAG TPA: PAS domain-containing protein, partial [Azonexus sp.]|nr:PAS domain-containing protein [Azonexus sp.]
MRTNLPVTNTEYLMQEGQSIVSKTDTKGRITYINPSFIEVSGFAEAELIGKAHNIVRHPDMPPEAFADMWETLQAGEPWTGMVKNRRKNGDFYWVVANVVPIRERGQTVGYMSVRTAPTRDQVRAADELYRKLRAGGSGIVLRRGKVVRAGLAGRLAALRSLPLGTRLAVAMGGQAVLFAALAFAVDGVAWRVLAGLAAFGSLFGLGYLNRHLVRPLDDATRAVYALAGGDLEHAAPHGGSDEMGR